MSGATYHGHLCAARPSRHLEIIERETGRTLRNWVLSAEACALCSPTPSWATSGTGSGAGIEYVQSKERKSGPGHRRRCRARRDAAFQRGVFVRLLGGATATPSRAFVIAREQIRHHRRVSMIDHRVERGLGY